MTDKFVIIDGNSLTFRAFYGLPPLTSSDGEPCGAIFGFCKMLINVLQKTEPKHIVVAFDAGKHTFRHDIFNEYKGTRNPTPEDLKQQFPILKGLLQEMGIKVIEMEDIEADDLIGSCARKFSGEKILVSGDRDLLQLVDSDTKVWLTQKGITDVLEVDEKVLKEKYGVEPYQIIEMKAIMGDKSDNIPGVKGVGEKTALKLLDEYKDLDNIYLNIENIKGKLHDLLTEQKEMAYISKKLATIKTNVKLDFCEEDCAYNFPFNRKVYEIMKRFEFKSIISHDELFEKSEKVEKKQTFEVVNSSDFDELLELLNRFKYEPLFSMELKEASMHFSDGKKEYVFDLIMLNSDDVLRELKSILENEKITKVLFETKALKHYFNNFNIKITNFFDCSVAVYLADESEGNLKFDVIQENNGLDLNVPASNLIVLKNKLEKYLHERGQWELYQDIELKLVDVLYDMEVSGIKIDVDEIGRLSKKYKEEQSVLLADFRKVAGDDVNINSPKQLQKLLFEDLKLTYKGKKSTSVEVLEAIREQHEVIDTILRYRKISKIISTYLEGMLPFVDSTKKIHTTFLQNFTSTGRLSSRDPNLQNIPVRDEESKALRGLFTSSFDGGSIMSADYNQIELRLMAIFSKDENLLNDFKAKHDVHSITASKIFNIPLSDVTPQERRVAKAVNFGIIYGISEYGLSKNINTSAKQAKEFITRYFELYPSVKLYMEKSIEFARNNGYVKTLFNRIRHLSQINSSNYTTRMFEERVALNMPLQGTASDIIKLAMIEVASQIKKRGLKSKLILQIHDELILDVFPGEEEACKEVLKSSMEGVTHFELPLEVNISYGKTWLDAK